MSLSTTGPSRAYCKTHQLHPRHWRMYVIKRVAALPGATNHYTVNTYSVVFSSIRAFNWQVMHFFPTDTIQPVTKWQRTRFARRTLFAFARKSSYGVIWIDMGFITIMPQHCRNRSIGVIDLFKFHLMLPGSSRSTTEGLRVIRGNGSMAVQRPLRWVRVFAHREGKLIKQTVI